MLGRKKNSDDDQLNQGSSAITATPNAQQHPPRPGAKNRPTPKRKDQEAARRRPIVPADREAAKKADKERQREARQSARAAAERGDESALPQRDRGPEKRYIRDRVDSRLSMGEIAMPLMLLAIVTLFIPNPAVQSYALLVVWAIVIVGAIDSFLLWRRIRSSLEMKFGKVPPRAASYTIMRTFQLRRARFPRPQVKRGDKIK